MSIDAFLVGAVLGFIVGSLVMLAWRAFRPHRDWPLLSRTLDRCALDMVRQDLNALYDIVNALAKVVETTLVEIDRGQR